MRGADIRSIQALADLRAGLMRFGADTEAALRAMDAQVRQTLEYLGERQRHWEAKVRAAEEEYRRAWAALQACQSREYTDPKTGRTYIPPCTQEQEWVRRASQALAEAQARLREVVEWRRLVERTAEEFQRQARRMAAWVREELPKASRLLESKVNTLYAYASLGPGGGSTFAQATFTTLPPADAAASTAALGALLAAVGIGVAGIATIRWLSQGVRKALGDVGEALAADLTQQEGNLREIPFDQPKHGFDRVFLTSNGRVVILESKVHKRGEFHPGQTQHGEQGSPEWVAATAEKMADPFSAQWSPANERIAALIRDMGMENVPVVAVVIETETGQAHIYHRQSNEMWTPLQEGISLAEVLSADTNPPTPPPGGLERETSPEREIAGGPEQLG
ncbi:MAG: hypothetical protein H5T61_13500 [Thermoflexales bacterium]|nr:hypothetical protein [Thermoflexales bacterium]